MKIDFVVKRPYEVGEIIERRVGPKFWVVERWVVIEVSSWYDFATAGPGGFVNVQKDYERQMVAQGLGSVRDDKIMRCIKEETGEEAFAMYKFVWKK